MRIFNSWPARMGLGTGINSSSNLPWAAASRKPSMVVGGVGVGGVAGGPGGVVVCPERKDANKRNAAARRINGDSPRGN